MFQSDYDTRTEPSENSESTCAKNSASKAFRIPIQTARENIGNSGRFFDH